MDFMYYVIIRSMIKEKNMTNELAGAVKYTNCISKEG